MGTITEHVNGKLAKVTGPAMHTFRDSGIAVRIHKIPPMTNQELMAQVRRELMDEEPKPPLVEVDYGQGKVMEPNKGDPTYVQRLQVWEAKASRIANERLFKYAALAGVEITLGNEERAQIAHVKRHMKLIAKVEWKDDPDLTEDENLQYFYVRHICCATGEDIKEFYQAIAQRSQPTEAAIELHKQSFPGDL